jgi:thioredoxin 1
MMKDQRQSNPPKPLIPEPTTDLQFRDKVIRSLLPTVVYVWAPRSPQCELMEKEIERLAHEYLGKVCFFSINADKNPETFGRYGIRSVPTLLFFHDSRVVDRIVGLIPTPPLRARVDYLLETSSHEKGVVDVSANLAKWETEPTDDHQRAFVSIR